MKDMKMMDNKMEPRSRKGVTMADLCPREKSMAPSAKMRSGSGKAMSKSKMANPAKA